MFNNFQHNYRLFSFERPGLSKLQGQALQNLQNLMTRGNLTRNDESKSSHFAPDLIGASFEQ